MCLRYIESSKVEITKEYSVLYKMRNDITRLFNIEIPEEEIVYLSNQIISSCVQHLEITNFIFENWVHIQIVLRDFISAVEMELGVALKARREVVSRTANTFETSFLQTLKMARVLITQFFNK